MARAIHRYNAFLTAQSTGLNILLMFALTVVSFYLMAFVIVPAFNAATAGLDPFDLNFGITAEQMYEELPYYTDESRRLYIWFALADYVYPLANAGFFALLWAWLFRTSPNALLDRLKCYGMLLLPFLFTLIDWSENLGFLIVVFGYPAEYPAIGDLAGLLKGSKSRVLSGIVLLTIGFVAIAASARIHARRKRGA
jgi:hypothetical protein